MLIIKHELHRVMFLNLFADEFPWTCLVLTSTDDFIGGCAIIPPTTDNDISQGTTRVITVAHRLAALQPKE
jgi:hypothetical protein